MTTETTETSWRVWQRDTWLYTQTLLSAAFGLLASLVLSVEAYQLAGNANTVLPCNINAVLSCGTVAASDQAVLFGFPNAFIGLMTEAAILMFAFIGLSGANLNAWALRVVQVGVTLGFGFSYWMLYESVYVIRVLCPWCLLVTTTTTLVFAAVTTLNLRKGTLGLPRVIQTGLESALRLGLDLMGLIAWFLLMATLIVAEFGSALFA